METEEAETAENGATVQTFGRQLCSRTHENSRTIRAVRAFVRIVPSILWLAHEVRAAAVRRESPHRLETEEAETAENDATKSRQGGEPTFKDFFALARAMNMPLAQLGNSGARVSRIGLGTMGFGAKTWRGWVIERDASIPIIKKALDLGVNFLDTADMYSLGESERIVGQAIEGRRDEVVLATKVYHSMGSGPNDHGLSRKHIEHAMKQSLERLRTDYVDLYQIHRYDAFTPQDEFLGTLSSLVERGSARYLGASTMYAWQFALLLARQREKDWHPFVTMQNHYNLVYREEEREMLPLCRAQGVGMIPWSPLARGFLAGPDKRSTGLRATIDAGRAFYRQEQDLEIAERVDTLAQEKKVASAQIALAWLLHQPGVVAPIVGVTKMEQLEDAIAATQLRLSDSELKFLSEAYEPKRLAGWLRGGGVPREHLDENEPET